MTKITISVSKVYKNSGSFRFHRKNTKQYWKHFFLEDGNLGTEWVSAVKASFLKIKKNHQLKYLCENGHIFKAIVKNAKVEVDCPHCDD